MALLPDTITSPVGRLGAAAQNALEVARFGGLVTEDEPSPFEIAGEHRVYKLRHYYPPAGAAGAAGDASDPPGDPAGEGAGEPAAGSDNGSGLARKAGPPVLLI